MANIIVLAASVSHAATTNVAAVFTDAGDNVDIVSDTDTSTTPELLQAYDLILCARATSNNLKVSNLIKGALAAGIPVMGGSYGGISADTPFDKIWEVELGLISSAISSNSNGQISVIDDPYGFYKNIITYPFSQSVYPANNFMYSYKTPDSSGVVIANSDYGDLDPAIIAFSTKDPVSTTGQRLGAKVIINGALYGSAGITEAQKAAMLEMRDWLLRPALETTIKGVVTLDGVPFRSKVVALTASEPPKYLGYSFSDKNTGEYEFNLNTLDPVMVYTIQEFGEEWTPSKVINAGDVVHPTTPNGYVYIANTAGSTGKDEPTWPTTEFTTLTDGTVTFKTEILLKPVIQGYLKPQVKVR